MVMVAMTETDLPDEWVEMHFNWFHSCESDGTFHKCRESREDIGLVRLDKREWEVTTAVRLECQHCGKKIEYFYSWNDEKDV